MHAHFLALEKEFGWLFIYVNTLEVKHIERTVQWKVILSEGFICHSYLATSSSKCSVASAAAKARAAAEAARTRVTFAQKELELKKQKAKLDLEKATLQANLEALELEKEAAAANAEAEVLDAAARKECEDTPIVFFLIEFLSVYIRHLV